jgi:mannose-1-phosphate guanylyltransferase
MRIDHCLILAAGFGTRMGKIGQQLPKVLWPVFEKSLLELQVAYARSLGIEKIYINLHYMGEQIEEYCKTRAAFEGVQFLWEKPEILDIGGAIHNLASRPKVMYKGKLLVLNADQFFYLKKEDLSKILRPYEKHAGVLFSYWVNSSLGYNALEINPDRLVKSIVKNKDLGPNQRVETYTGISYIDLAQLDKVSGPSSFFETVCPFTKKNIPAILLENVDYWDFGTVERYWKTCFNILETYRTRSTHPFLRFLVTERAMKTWKINLQNLSYHAKSPKVINLNPDEELQVLKETIVLGGNGVKANSEAAIWWNNIHEEVKCL